MCLFTNSKFSFHAPKTEQLHNKGELLNEVDVIVHASKLSATVYNAKINVIRYIF